MSAPTQSRAEFVAEATDTLDSLARDLAALEDAGESRAQPGLINGIFRSAHSLKGLAGMFGVTPIANLAHALEELLDCLRLGKVALSGEVQLTLHEVVDVLQAMLRDEAQGTATVGVAERTAELESRLVASRFQPEARAVASVAVVDALPESMRASLTEYEEHRLNECGRRGDRLWLVSVAFPIDQLDRELISLNSSLSPHGEVVSTLPGLEAAPEGSIGFELLVASAAPKKKLLAAVSGFGAQAKVLWGKRTKRSSVRARAVTAPVNPQPRVELEATLRPLSQMVRVDIGRLDRLMNAVGELLLVKANLQRIGEQAQQGAVVGPRALGQELARETRALERRLEELQQGLLAARMVPVSQVFDKLARLARRVAHESGKEVDVEVSGGDVELDKLIVEELADPLMHLLRNAIDHGVETPNARERSGKRRRGTIALAARPMGNQVVLEVTDDGAGLALERIREVAVARGLLPAEQAPGLDGRELAQLVFLPGFSTARSVSEISGRGVGLDVVKTNIARLSGMIDVNSQPGQGLSVFLTLPVTLAIIRALVVGVGGQTYAVPLNSVVELLTVEPAAIRTVERREVIEVRGQTLPFVRLARLFRLPERAERRWYVMVVGLAQQRAALAVDALLGQENVVIKSLRGRLSRVPGIAGATELGLRRTVLVLDVGALIQEVTNSDLRADLS